MWGKGVKKGDSDPEDVLRLLSMAKEKLKCGFAESQWLVHFIVFSSHA